MDNALSSPSQQRQMWFFLELSEPPNKSWGHNIKCNSENVHFVEVQIFISTLWKVCRFAFNTCFKGPERNSNLFACVADIWLHVYI